MVRVAAYCRVSSEKEDQAGSFEAQQRFFREWIAQNPNWCLQEIYADEGISGTNTKKRTQFNRMIRAAREGRIDLIITKEVSRFARNTIDTLEYTRELRKRGIGVIFLNDNINTMDSDGELRLTIMSSIAQNESRLTSDRVKWGQKRCMERGVVFGGSLLGYDVEHGKIEINPEGANTVRMIFHKYLNERKGSVVIARELREEGIPSSRGNLNWTSATVLKILKNEKYCGDLIQQKTYTPDYLTHEKKYNRGQLEFVVLRDHHEPIIDRVMWEAAQQEMTRRRSRWAERNAAHGNRYPLSGKLKCGRCGSGFTVRTKKNHRGEVYKIWRCGKATAEGAHPISTQGARKGCDIGRQIREDTAMEILRHTVDAVALDREEVIARLTYIVNDSLKSRESGPNREIRRLDKTLEGEESRKQKALEAFLLGSISQSDYQFISERYDRKIAQIKRRIDTTALQAKRADAFEFEINAVRDRIRSIVWAENCGAEFYGSLLDSMTIYADGRVEVALNALSARWYYALK